jgi:NAD(P)-dependent dehydrogenase (short-subunit alcohol dehydrogenase family)
MSYQSNDKAVLVTGALGGIGRAISIQLAEKGYLVVGVDKKEDASFKFDNVDLYKADISDPGANERLFSVIKAKYGSLYGIVNNAAVQICKSIEDMTLDDWDTTMSVNVRSVFLSIHNAYPSILQSNGAVVNICSVHSMATSRYMSAYAASKGAMLSLTRSLAIELAKDNIRVNAVIPGAIDTQMLMDGMKRDISSETSLDEKYDVFSKKHPLARIGRADEVAKVVSFLLDGDQSSFMTGQSIVVDGGALARLSTE